MIKALRSEYIQGAVAALVLVAVGVFGIAFLRDLHFAIPLSAGVILSLALTQLALRVRLAQQS